MLMPILVLMLIPMLMPKPRHVLMLLIQFFSPAMNNRVELVGHIVDRPTPKW